MLHRMGECVNAGGRRMGAAGQLTARVKWAAIWDDAWVDDGRAFCAFRGQK
ncbi:MAG: hypothetical protein IPH54_20695 [Rhodoferax sp.]|nr:hypothetical protein [Rhodoferax sp.]